MQIQTALCLILIVAWNDCEFLGSASSISSSHFGFNFALAADLWGEFGYKICGQGMQLLYSFVCYLHMNTTCLCLATILFGCTCKLHSRISWMLGSYMYMFEFIHFPEV